MHKYIKSEIVVPSAPAQKYRRSAAFCQADVARPCARRRKLDDYRARLELDAAIMLKRSARRPDEPNPKRNQRNVASGAGYIDRNAPLRLSHAAAIAFPGAGMTASGFRKEAGTDRLVIHRVANRQEIDALKNTGML
jgi:hypothetical protein